MSHPIPFETTLTVRFCETDAVGHVGNTVLVQWFEAARDPIFSFFTSELDISNWPLILASYKVDFHQQIYYGKPVTIKTYISRIGGSSFDVHQQVWQNEKHCATGLTTLVHFDFKTKRSVPISAEVKAEMGKHLLEQ